MKQTDFSNVVRNVPQLSRGIVWCVTCGRQQRVNASQSLQKGWPQCCGFTMTIDSPEERAAMAVPPPRSAEGT